MTGFEGLGSEEVKISNSFAWSREEAEKTAHRNRLSRRGPDPHLLVVAGREDSPACCIKGKRSYEVGMADKRLDALSRRIPEFDAIKRLRARIESASTSRRTQSTEEWGIR
jgi:hypothetical protein